jgi:two-component system CheB/CheR fusion protein
MEPTPSSPSGAAGRDPLDLHDLLEAAATAAVVLDADLRVERYTPAATELFPLRAADIGRPLTELACLADWPQLATDLRRVLGRTQPVERELGAADGRWWRLRLLPRRGGGALLVASEAGAHRQAEQERRWLAAAIAATPDAIVGLALDTTIRSWSAGAMALFGWSEGEALGRPLQLLLPTHDAEVADPLQWLAQEGVTRGTAQGRRKDGRELALDVALSPVRDADGHLLGAVLVTREQAGLGADPGRERFLAVLSHELRNPLASIASAAELLQLPELPQPALQKAVQVVQRQVRAMKVMLDELVDVSRMAPGPLALARKPVPVSAFVQAALDTVGPLVQAAGHQLELRLPAEPLQVDGDPQRLAQVVASLVGNATRYTPEGGHITVEVAPQDGEAVLSVQDDGIGMEADQLARLFEPSGPGGVAPQRPEGGLGLGLVVARRIVEQHGGWIMASSDGPGRGLLVRVGLPLLHLVEQPGQAEPPAPQPLQAAPAAQGELVLVADDNADAAWGLAKLLELAGFRTLLARSGEEALRLAAEHHPAVALLDIGMPGLSGHDVARRLRAEPWGRRMALIAATGWGQDTDVQASLEAGFDAHLTKPLNVARVQELVDGLVAGRREG